jgi:hypothetical protein
MSLIKANTDENNIIKPLEKEELYSYIGNFFKNLYNTIPFEKLNKDIIDKEELKYNIENSVVEFSKSVTKWYTDSQTLLSKSNEANNMYKLLQSIPSPINSESAGITKEFKNYQNPINVTPTEEDIVGIV